MCIKQYYTECKLTKYCLAIFKMTSLFYIDYIKNFNFLKMKFSIFIKITEDIPIPGFQAQFHSPPVASLDQHTCLLQNPSPRIDHQCFRLDLLLPSVLHFLQLFFYMWLARVLSSTAGNFPLMPNGYCFSLLYLTWLIIPCHLILSPSQIVIFSFPALPESTLFFLFPVSALQP